MKINILNYSNILAILFILLLYNCKKETPKEILNPNAVVPEITTKVLSALHSTKAISGGNITNDGGAAVTKRGICWSTSQMPTITDNKTNDGAGTGRFISNITGLSPNTTYYIRAYATNSAGTGYGSEVSFKTSLSGSDTVNDIDGNVYPTVTIGTQVWMAENLKVIHYRNGDPIPNVTDEASWKALLTGAYCNFNNDANLVTTYGRLYNWYSVNDSRNIAPAGWHVPTDNEWKALTIFLGETESGNKIKESGTTLWHSPNTGATNETDFTALPAGFRSNGKFVNLGMNSVWWSVTGYDLPGALCTNVDYNMIYASTGGTSDKTNGFSIRCVKN